MIKEFVEGKYYVCILKRRGNSWNGEGKMDMVLDGKPRKCIVGNGNLAVFEGMTDGYLWAWGSEEFVEYSGWVNASFLEWSNICRINSSP